MRIARLECRMFAEFILDMQWVNNIPVFGDVLVPVNGVCLITSTVNGNVYVSTGANLTVVGGTINGGLEVDHATVVTLKNSSVSGFTGLYNVQTVTISGSRLNTSGNLSICTDACGAAMYAGGRGFFSMTNSNVTGQVENEVGHETVVKQQSCIREVGD